MVGEFDQWAADALRRGDVDALLKFREVPSARYAHPSTEHFAPLFVTLGLSDHARGDTASPITGFYLGLSKRSVQFA